jgi:hypothetical protein
MAQKLAYKPPFDISPQFGRTGHIGGAYMPDYTVFRVRIF